MKYTPPGKNENKNHKKNRVRNVIWYNPPYNNAVISNIGRDFLQIVDEEFPRDHPLNKVFNRNTMKISYGCMTNVRQIITGQNKLS